MTIDPVLLAAEELHLTEVSLSRAALICRSHDCRKNRELVDSLLSRSKELFRALFKTAPTSAVGAAELIRIAAGRSPFARSKYASHMRKIADGFSKGQRNHADLVWLRAMHGALLEGLYGKDGMNSAPLLELAIAGAARPVMIFRAVQPLVRKSQGRGILAVQPS
jgi:hypothetical protein